MTALTPGTRVDRYELVSLLGEGTFGVVWKARDVKFQTARFVALKLLRPELAHRAEIVARFEGEAEVLAKLRHPNVISVLDRGQCELGPYIAVEYIDGQSLADWLDDQQRAGKSPDLAMVRDMFLQICAGVEAAHSVSPAPIVHRDLKPENVMLRRAKDRLVPAILDFGVARDGERSKHSRTGDTHGTPTYMAPEQWQGAASEVGTWSDVFALAVLFVQMLTFCKGPDPSKAGTAWWYFVLVSGGEVRDRLLTLCGAVSPEVREVIARALDRHPGGRHKHAGALRAELEKAWSSEQTPSPPSREIPALEPPAPSGRPRSARTSSWMSSSAHARASASAVLSRRVPWRFVVGFGALVLLGIALVFWGRRTGAGFEVNSPDAGLAILAEDASWVRAAQDSTSPGSSATPPAVSSASTRVVTAPTVTVANLAAVRDARDVRDVRDLHDSSGPAEACAEACAASGRCRPRAGGCFTDDASCSARPACKESGACRASGDGATCVAASDDDCRVSTSCVSAGLCALRDGACRATSDEHCKLSGQCGLKGACTASAGRCIATRDEDCKRSLVCQNGACSAVNGACQRR